MTNDQRRSRRLPICDERTAAVLEVGSESRPAELLNVSAEGFGLRLESSAGIDEGQVLLLRTPGGAHQVRVVRLESGDSGSLVGLRRIADVVERPKPRLAVGRRIGWFESLEWTPTLIGGLIAAVIAAAIVVAPMLAR